MLCYLNKTALSIEYLFKQHLLILHCRNVFSAVLLAIVFGTCVFHWLVLYIRTCTEIVILACTSSLLPHPNKVHCISPSLYGQWSWISDSEYAEGIVRMLH